MKKRKQKIVREWVSEFLNKEDSDQPDLQLGSFDWKCPKCGTDHVFTVDRNEYIASYKVTCTMCNYEGRHAPYKHFFKN